MTKPEWPVIPDGAEYDLIWSGEIRYYGAMDYELKKAELRRAYPEWQIWYVPMTTGAPTWHARPRVALTAASPGELEQMLDEAQRESKGFDPEGDTWVRAGGC